MTTQKEVKAFLMGCFAGLLLISAIVLVIVVVFPTLLRQTPDGIISVTYHYQSIPGAVGISTSPSKLSNCTSYNTYTFCKSDNSNVDTVLTYGNSCLYDGTCPQQLNANYR